MSKIDWSKDKREYDPARVQRVDDFVEPDPVIISVTPLKPKERLSLARRLKSAVERARATQRKRAKKAANIAATETQQAASAAKKAKQAERQARREAQRETRQRELAAKIAAEDAWKQSPEYAALKAAEDAHVEACARERRKALQAQREPLRQRWRDQLLKR